MVVRSPEGVGLYVCVIVQVGTTLVAVVALSCGTLVVVEPCCTSYVPYGGT